MSKKHILNAGICCICTAVIFGLHFFVYGRMLLDNPVLIGATCAVFIASAAGRTGEEREPWFPPNHIVTRLCQLIWCAILCTIPYVLCIEPYSLDNWIFLPLWATLSIIELRYREQNSTAYAAAMVAVLCITGAFLLITHPITASQAQNIVEQEATQTVFTTKSIPITIPRIKTVGTARLSTLLRPNRLTSPTVTPFPQTRMAQNTVFLFLIFAEPLTRNKNKEFNLYGIQNHHQTGRLGAEARRI